MLNPISIKAKGGHMTPNMTARNISHQRSLESLTCFHILFIVLVNGHDRECFFLLSSHHDVRKRTSNTS